jgi:hypothetical protein
MKLRIQECSQVLTESVRLQDGKVYTCRSMIVSTRENVTLVARVEFNAVGRSATSHRIDVRLTDCSLISVKYVVTLHS